MHSVLKSRFLWSLMLLLKFPNCLFVVSCTTSQETHDRRQLQVVESHLNVFFGRNSKSLLNVQINLDVSASGRHWEPHTDRSCVQSLSVTCSVKILFTHVHLSAVEHHTHTLGRGAISVCSALHFVPTLRVGWSLRDCSLPVSRTHASLWIERSRYFLLEASGNAQSFDTCRSPTSV